uniref:Uncharacterized protein n=1 Tax=Mycena chlorophos TaxID=658473 RepID=A0ABQ0LC64_MYCCL|nr:predicted protein [Mycena chlorophos]
MSPALQARSLSYATNAENGTASWKSTPSRQPHASASRLQEPESSGAGSLLSRIGGREPTRSLLERMNLDDEDSRLSSLEEGQMREQKTPKTPLLNGHFISPLRKEENTRSLSPVASTSKETPLSTASLKRVLTHAVYHNATLRKGDPAELDLQSLDAKVEATVTAPAVDKFAEKLLQVREQLNSLPADKRAELMRQPTADIASFNSPWPPPTMNLDQDSNIAASDRMKKAPPTGPRAMRDVPTSKGKERARSPSPRPHGLPRRPISVERGAFNGRRIFSPPRRTPSPARPFRRYSRSLSRSRSPTFNSRRPLEKRRFVRSPTPDRGGYRGRSFSPNPRRRHPSRSPPPLRRKFSPGYYDRQRSRSRSRSRSRRRRSRSLDSSVERPRNGFNPPPRRAGGAGGPTPKTSPQIPARRPSNPNLTQSPISPQFPRANGHSHVRGPTPQSPVVDAVSAFSKSIHASAPPVRPPSPIPMVVSRSPSPRAAPPTNPCNHVPGIWFAKVGAQHARVNRCNFIIEPGMAAIWCIPSEADLPQRIEDPETEQPKLCVKLFCLQTAAVASLLEKLAADSHVTPGRRANAVAELQTRWPAEGVFVQVNVGHDNSGGGKSWIPRELEPPNQPLDLTPHIHIGTNSLEIIQLARKDDCTFVLCGLPRAEPDAADEAFEVLWMDDPIVDERDSLFAFPSVPVS